MKRTASFSECGAYRYTLGRQWDASRQMLSWIMLNPSTADAEKEDPTIRRCIGFAHRWGYGGIRVLNLFAFRATRPEVMKAQADPVGPKNDSVIIELTRSAMVIAAWGADGTHLDRERTVCRILEDAGAQLHVLSLTKAGHPGHPLYIGYDVRPFPWTASAPASAAAESGAASLAAAAGADDLTSCGLRSIA